MNGSAERYLTTLFRRCLVRVATVTEFGVDGEGSGVWVAPGTVLTCAHVVQPAPGRTVTVGWDGRHLAAEIVEWAPERTTDGGLWPYPDIAVLRVPDAPAHPCAWLTEQQPVLGADLLALGYSEIYGPGEEASAHGQFAGFQTLNGAQLWRFTDDEIAPGMSGGPVLDLVQGAVCGLVKTTRKTDSTLGGLVLPLHALRELPATGGAPVWLGHDRFHAADAAWSERRAALVEADGGATVGRSAAVATCTVDEETDVLGLLADLDPVDDLDRRYADAVAPARPAPDPTLSLARDAFYALVDRFAQPGQLHPVLRFAAGLAADGAPAAVADRIREWTVRVAARRGDYRLLEAVPAPRPVRGAPAGGTVTVQIEPSSVDASRFGLTIWIDSGAGNVKVYCDDRAVHTLDAIRGELVEQLRTVLKQVHGGAVVEFVTPMSLFDEGFEALTVTRPWTRLGRTNPVVLRDLDRLRDSETWSAWRERWERMRAGGPAATPTWLVCTDAPSADQFDGRVRATPDLAVLALARRPADAPRREALEVALYAGVPVLIWRRDTCVEHDRSSPVRPCSGDRFRAAVTAALHEQSTASRPVPLPELVRLLRSAAAENADHDCREIVLLWDDPYRLPEPPAPLLSPRSS